MLFYCLLPRRMRCGESFVLEIMAPSVLFCVPYVHSRCEVLWRPFQSLGVLWIRWKACWRVNSNVKWTRTVSCRSIRAWNWFAEISILVPFARTFAFAPRVFPETDGVGYIYKVRFGTEPFCWQCFVPVEPSSMSVKCGFGFSWGIPLAALLSVPWSFMYVL